MLLAGKRAMSTMAVAATLVCAVFAGARGQTDREEDQSRGVRIIAAPTSPTENPPVTPKSPNGDTENHPLLTPATPAPVTDLANPSAPAPAAPSQAAAPPPAGAPLAPAIAPPQNEVTAPALPEPAAAPSISGTVAKLPTQTDNGVGVTKQDLEALASAIKIPNAAGLSMKINPGIEVAAGAQVSFSVSTKKEGYLILIDVDASGKLTQIYPNPMSLMAPGNVHEQSNLIRPGKTLQIPDQTSAYTGFEFIASPPIGTAMVIALLSDRPVQLVDLPDVPAPVLGGVSTVDYLIKVANELRIPNAAGGGSLKDAHWSFDVRFYAIRQRVISPE
jgi:Domain of unknown function (DUF4384)